MYDQIYKWISLIVISCSYIIVVLNSHEDQQLIKAERKIIILPKSYATVNQGRDIKDLDFEQMELSFGNYSDYKVEEFIGKGASGYAYLGRKRSTNEKVVMKIFKSVKWRSIKREIKFIKEVEGHPNISPLLDIVTNENEVSLIYSRYVTVPTGELFMNTNDQGNKFFMYQTLLALNHVHSRGIIHSDMKPANIITNPKTKLLKLIDWGLSSFYLPGHPLSPKVGTRTYKAPELLLGYKYYDYEIDIFSVGLMFSRMIFKNQCPFNQIKIKQNGSEMEYIVRLAKVLGTEPYQQYARELGLKTEQINQIKVYPKLDFKQMINKKNQEYCSDQAIDLLERMLIYNHTERITAQEALKHSYFDSIKNYINQK